MHAGRDATFVGNADACFSVLSVDGRTLSLFAVDSPKARMAAYALDGECDRVFRGPSPNAVAFSALDWPDTNRRERVRSGAGAKARSDGPRGCFGVLHNADGRGRRMEGYLTLEPRERVVRALFQRVPELRDVDPDGTPAGAVAVLTSRAPSPRRVPRRRGEGRAVRHDQTLRDASGCFRGFVRVVRARAGVHRVERRDGDAHAGTTRSTAARPAPGASCPCAAAAWAPPRTPTTAGRS